jgi:hypothetical protein
LKTLKRRFPEHPLAESNRKLELEACHSIKKKKKKILNTKPPVLQVRNKSKEIKIHLLQKSYNKKKNQNAKNLSWSTKKPHVIAKIGGSVTVLYNQAGIL